MGTQNLRRILKVMNSTARHVLTRHYKWIVRYHIHVHVYYCALTESDVDSSVILTLMQMDGVGKKSMMDIIAPNVKGKPRIIRLIASIVQDINVYCPECPPGGTIGHPGGQQKKFLPFGHGRAFNGTGLQNKSFQDRAEIIKA